MAQTTINLKLWREKRFMTQAELAKLSGVSETTIVRIEQGQGTPTFNTVKKLAKALGVDPLDIAPYPEELNSAIREKRMRAGRAGGSVTRRLALADRSDVRDDPDREKPDN